MNELNDWIKVRARSRNGAGGVPWWAWGLMAIGGLSILVGWLLRKRVREPKSMAAEAIPFITMRISNMTLENISPVVQEIPLPAQREILPEQAIQDDDLTKIEGIGPKIAGVLKNAGIHTFTKLAVTPVRELEQILQSANIRLGNPATWPEQAQMAAAGDWEGLQKMQDQLTGGRKM